MISLILNFFFLRKTPFCVQRDFANLNLTNQGYQYKSFQGHQRTLFQFIQRMYSNSFKHTCTINKQFQIKVGRIQTIMIWNWFTLIIVILVITLNVLLCFYYRWEEDQENSDNCFKNIHSWSAKKDNALSSFSNGSRWQDHIMKTNFKEIYTRFVMLALGAPDHS